MAICLGWENSARNFFWGYRVVLFVVSVSTMASRRSLIETDQPSPKRTRRGRAIVPPNRYTPFPLPPQRPKPRKKALQPTLPSIVMILPSEQPPREGFSLLMEITEGIWPGILNHFFTFQERIDMFEVSKKIRAMVEQGFYESFEIIKQAQLSIRIFMNLLKHSNLQIKDSVVKHLELGSRTCMKLNGYEFLNRFSELEKLDIGAPLFESSEHQFTNFWIALGSLRNLKVLRLPFVYKNSTLAVHNPALNRSFELRVCKVSVAADASELSFFRYAFRVILEEDCAVHGLLYMPEDVTISWTEDKCGKCHKPFKLESEIPILDLELQAEFSQFLNAYELCVCK